MNPGALATIAVIVSIFGGIATIYSLARSAAREAARERETQIGAAIEQAERPYKDRIAVLTVDNDRLTRTNERLTSRIDQLEDELRRSRGQ